MATLQLRMFFHSPDHSLRTGADLTPVRCKCIPCVPYKSITLDYGDIIYMFDESPPVLSIKTCPLGDSGLTLPPNTPYSYTHI